MTRGRASRIWRVAVVRCRILGLLCALAMAVPSAWADTALAGPALAADLSGHPAPLARVQQAAARRIVLREPPAGKTVAIRARSGDRYVVRFDPEAAQVKAEGQDLFFVFASRARIVFRNLGALARGANAPVFEVAEREIASKLLFAQALVSSDDSLAAVESQPGSAGGGYRLPAPPKHVIRPPGAGPSLPRRPPSQEQEQAAPTQRQERQASEARAQEQRQRRAAEARALEEQRRRAAEAGIRQEQQRQAAKARIQQQQQQQQQRQEQAAEAPAQRAPQKLQKSLGAKTPESGPAVQRARPAPSPRLSEEHVQFPEDMQQRSQRLDSGRASGGVRRNGDPAPPRVEKRVMASRAERPPAEPGDPVYNVEVDDKLSAEPLVLAHDRPVQVRFAIGPRAAGSVVPAIPTGPDLERLAAGEPLTLSVTLDCLVCREGTYASTEIVYDPSERRSDTAVFEIRPSRAAVAETRGYGLLIFTVDAKGLDLAVIKIPTFVDAVPPGLAVAEVPAVSFARPDVAGTIGPDLVIDIGSGAGKLPIGLNPVNTDLRDRMRAALRGRPWPNRFESGVTVADLSAIVAGTYKALRGIVEQNEAAVRAVYGAQGADTELSAGAARLRFEEHDKQVALAQMKRFGAFLYKRVFLEGDPDLRRALAALHDYAPDAGRPLRVRIRAADVYAPWQLLYSAPRGGPAVAEGFWGFRYEMGTLQKVNASQAPARTYLPPLHPDDVLLGAWRGMDEVGERGRFLHRHIGRRMGGTVPAVHNRADFLSAIRRTSRTLKLIVFYGHATSGTVVRPSAAAAAGAVTLLPTLATDWAGERLMFAEDDHLVPLQIDELIPDDVFDDEVNPVFLKQHPIVLLNACETGTGGTEPMTNNGFIGRLTMAGAGAVFVTEAPVWRNFAYQFGIDLLDRIGAGRTMQAALYEARLKHLEMQNNPLGLLYSLYGNPALRVAE